MLIYDFIYFFLYIRIKFLYNFFSFSIYTYFNSFCRKESCYDWTLLYIDKCNLIIIIFIFYHGRKRKKSKLFISYSSFVSSSEVISLTFWASDFISTAVSLAWISIIGIMFEYLSVIDLFNIISSTGTHLRYAL